jgi:LemA protein
MWIFVVIPIFGLFTLVILFYNRLVREKNLVREGWSGIDVQLRRRYNLIPNLVETVKGYAKHEKQLLEDVVKFRNQCIDAGKISDQENAENILTRGIRGLFALAEAYPDLKANKNFLELQNSLAEIEDQIQLARRYYNGTVRNYNIRVESFPSMIVAKLFNFVIAEYFEIDLAIQRELPEVQIS